MSTKRKNLSFGERLRELRGARDWSVYRLAEEAGVTRQYVHELERGKKSPGWDVACKLADALGVTLNDLRG